jgi:hypothetical protein
VSLPRIASDEYEFGSKQWVWPQIIDKNNIQDFKTKTYHQTLFR